MLTGRSSWISQSIRCTVEEMLFACHKIPFARNSCTTKSYIWLFALWIFNCNLQNMSSKSHTFPGQFWWWWRHFINKSLGGRNSYAMHFCQPSNIWSWVSKAILSRSRVQNHLPGLSSITATGNLVRKRACFHVPSMPGILQTRVDKGQGENRF